jgi:hypothetical protein
MTTMNSNHESNCFYIGTADGERVLYDSRDVVTHAMCVGASGSGKTGLCVGLLEEIALSGVPAIVIDPKGDLSNLLLTFPELRGDDFRPWMQPSRNGCDPATAAEHEARRWEAGLRESGLCGADVVRLRESAEFTVYTPASTAGRPISIIRSFDAPSDSTMQDRELLAERVEATAASLLALLGIKNDSFGKEHVFISTLLARAWTHGHALDLHALVRQIQDPTVAHVGAIETERFFPARQRAKLANRLNSLLAAPSFDLWLAGDPLDVERLLWTEGGRPRVSILSIAHLSDAERMFFVSLLLNEIVSWMRGQPGTSDLRAVVYADEIQGFLPPTKNPPSKTPMLTLLKQARAFGVGVILSTQNPVDLDYKALSNIGTWFIGRLQTERDKARLMQGLLSSDNPIPKRELEEMLAALRRREFLLHSSHRPGLVKFTTRHTMSYLRGPMTRDDIRRLMAGRRSETNQRELWERHYARRFDTLQRSLEETAAEIQQLETEIGEIHAKNVLSSVVNMIFGGRYGRVRALTRNGQSTAKLEKEHQAACERMATLQRELEELQAEVAANVAVG